LINIHLHLHERMFHYISVFMFLCCTIFALCFLYNTYYHKLHQATNPRSKSHHQSTQNHHGQQCREPHHWQPQNGHENVTFLLRTPPPPSVTSAATVGGLHRRRRSRGGYRQHKPPRPSPTMAAAASIVSIACAFQTLDGFLVSGSAAHTPYGCACTLYSHNYQTALSSDWVSY